MADEKQTNSDQLPAEQKPPEVDMPVPASPKKAGLRSKLHLTRKGVLVGVILLCLVAAGVGAYYLKNRNSSPNISTDSQEYIIKVNGKTYAKDGLSYLIRPVMESRKVSEDEAIDLIYKTLVTIEIGKSLAVEPSEDAVTAEVKKTPGTDNLTGFDLSWIRTIAKSNIVERTLETLKVNGTGFKGYSYIFRFSQNQVLSPVSTDNSPGYGNKELIEQDKQYAKSKADEYHKKLADKTITPDKALEEIKNDPRLGFMNAPGANESIHYGLTAKSLIQDVYFETVLSFIQDSKVPGLTDMQIGKTAIKPEPQNDADYAETYYYFVLVEKTGKTSTEYTKTVEEVTQKINQASESRER